MKTATVIVTFVALAVRAWGQSCTTPTPVFTPKNIPPGETQPLELHGFVRTQLSVSSFAMVSSIYGASGYPWEDCREQVYTRITGSGTFLAISVPTKSSTDYLIRETGLNSQQAPYIINTWSMENANTQPPITGQRPLLDWDHEAIRLPNGWTAMFGHEEMLVTNANQCPTADFPTNYCDVMGAKLVVMDNAGTVEWVWDSFDSAQFPYFNRRAVLGETCTPSPDACPITLAKIAQDWLHANSIWYDPVDGNLVLNLRNQNWTIKVAYENGTGDGHVIWRLGKDGDFTMIPTSVSDPWEDHPHDVTSPETGVYSMFDNGDGRYAKNPSATSRGLVYVIDEAELEVIGIHVYPLPIYSGGNGSAQLLTNGNWMFMAGYPVNSQAQVYSEEFEFAPDTTTPLWTEQLPQQYRMTRLSSLFQY
jgi:hypothetical protein